MTAVGAPLLTACSIAIACAVLSVFVVSRRWAFIGEGISHSGFGGAGTAWILVLLFPRLDYPWLPFATVVVFCLITGLLIGYFSRTQRVNSDAVIGVFLVASLAWGIVAQQIYRQVRHVDPVGWDVFLFGRMTGVSPLFAVAALTVSVAVLAIVVMLGKEIVYYCFDPAMAEASGVAVGFIHYLMMILLSLTIVIGVCVVGSVLVTALLVLPGAIALLLSRRLFHSIAISVICGLLGALTGVLASHLWPVLPAGPAIVLALFFEFVLAYTLAPLARSRFG